MAAVRHLEFAKIAVLVSDLYRHVIFYLCSKFRFDRRSANMAHSQKTIFNMASVRHLNLQNYGFLLKIHDGN